MQERVTGPFDGYYVAVYACEHGDLGEPHRAYYKVCFLEPESYFDPGVCVLKGVIDQVAETIEEALLEAEVAARRQIDFFQSVAAYHRGEESGPPTQNLPLPPSMR
ncbi:MAG: hypothetical protein EON92_10590 [Burkholderiales bacterium]|nr:MAG: hypothetical protein EON92_10590 [Burkholderiales bacterium]